MPSTSPLAHTVTSFDFDGVLAQDTTRLDALNEENAHLRELLSNRSPTVPSLVSEAEKLKVELAAVKEAKEETERELKALRASQAASVHVEDQSSELSLLRSSLATLASELEAEKTHLAEVELKRREEEDTVVMLRSKVEESRRALMRLQGESSRKHSFSYDGTSSANPRRPSFGLSASFDPNTRRKSSLSGSCPTNSGLGLGFGGPEPPSKISPFGRLAHRRGSASISFFPESKDEDDRVARLRDLRLGLTSTKISSRRNSTQSNGDNGIPDFDFDLSQRRSSTLSAQSYPIFGRSHSISEESDSGRPSRPPSAPLRIQGRKQSLAVFENFPTRRDSYDSDYSAISFSDDNSEELMLQLQGLRIQLAESEEGRRASELCVKALKDYISSAPTVTDGESPLLLPPLPSASTLDDSPLPAAFPQKRNSSSRWSIPRLPIPSLGRRESLSAQSFASMSQTHLPTVTPRHPPSTSTFSTPIYNKPTPPNANPTPIFGAFSFSANVSNDSTPIDADTSPTMTSAEVFDSPYSSERERERLPTLHSSPEDMSETESHTSRAPSLTDSVSTCSEPESSPGSSRSGSPVRLSHPVFTDCHELFGGPRNTLDPDAFARKASVDPTTPTFACALAM